MNSSRLPAPSFNVEDQVCLLAKNNRSIHLRKKPDHKRLGKFKVIQVISLDAYKMELPAAMKIHPVFHVSFLELVAKDPIPKQVIMLPTPAEVEGQEEWAVEEILDTRVFHCRP